MFVILEYHSEDVKQAEIDTVNEAVAWAIEQGGPADVLKIFNQNGDLICSLRRKEWKSTWHRSAVRAFIVEYRVAHERPNRRIGVYDTWAEALTAARTAGAVGEDRTNRDRDRVYDVAGHEGDDDYSVRILLVRGVMLVGKELRPPNIAGQDWD